MTPDLRFFPEKCIACGNCALGPDTEEAPATDRFIDENGVTRHYRGNCYAGALVRAGQFRTATDIVDEVLQDKDYYDSSGGGVTLSGGEVSMQPAFACTLISLLKEAGVHTAVENNIAAPWKTLQPIISSVDLVIFDVKSLNNERHAEWTGIPNERILENARLIADSDVPIIVRTPIIPGFNDSIEDISAIARFIRPFPNLQYYELLNYNPLGADKYASMGEAYALADTEPLPSELISRLAEAAGTAQLPVRIA